MADTKSTDLWLRQLRKNLKDQRISIEQLEDVLEIKASAIHHRFNGRTEMSVTELLKICDHAGLDVISLFAPSQRVVSEHEMQVIEKLRSVTPVQKKVLRQIVLNFQTS
tara:strand:- start:881 stop:1207 length:327 start_codon:yes stop_codon:yes gene_type:complete